MPLPLQVRVKMSSEAAEYLTMTPVVQREIPFGELLEHIAAATGVDAARVADILKRGSIVSGATRYRWSAIETAVEELEGALLSLPGPEPERPFHANNCVLVMLHGPSARIEVSREAAERRRLFRRSSFWKALLAEGTPAYETYALRERADVYRLELDEDAARRMAEAAGLMPFDGLVSQIRAARITAVEFVVPRGGSSA